MKLVHGLFSITMALAFLASCSSEECKCNKSNGNAADLANGADENGATGSKGTSRDKGKGDGEDGNASVGEIDESKNELKDFEPKNVYALTLEAGPSKIVNFTITEGPAPVFKEIDDYECTEIPETDEEPEDVETPDTLSISYTFTEDVSDEKKSAANEDGFPEKDEVELAGDAVKDQPLGVTITYTGATGKFGKGTLNWKTKPEAVDDDFEVELELEIDGDAYEATVKGKVVEIPDQPDPPKCKKDEYPKPIYKK